MVAVMLTSGLQLGKYFSNHSWPLNCMMNSGKGVGGAGGEGILSGDAEMGSAGNGGALDTILTTGLFGRGSLLGRGCGLFNSDGGSGTAGLGASGGLVVFTITSSFSTGSGTETTSSLSL